MIQINIFILQLNGQGIIKVQNNFHPFKSFNILDGYYSVNYIPKINIKNLLGE
jgi:3-deoxy-D-manno-octulosonate 8-phosphate phosphatase KdsC-like HAD superfamily phosphatase